jgi:Trp operon repressor
MAPRRRFRHPPALQLKPSQQLVPSNITTVLNPRGKTDLRSNTAIILNRRRKQDLRSNIAIILNLLQTKGRQRAIHNRTTTITIATTTGHNLVDNPDNDYHHSPNHRRTTATPPLRQLIMASSSHRP